jgi:deazaflavin-dependent oxidoreductase (nitroreductase family)
MHDVTAKWLSKIHAGAYRATRGRIGRSFVNNSMLLLTTSGRRTGRPHTVPLLYLREGSRLVIIASWGGRDYPPHWYLNLIAHPEVSVQIEGNQFEATATQATDEHRAIWWPRIVQAYEGYAEYQTRTDRQIPVIFLDQV